MIANLVVHAAIRQAAPFRPPPRVIVESSPRAKQRCGCVANGVRCLGWAARLLWHLRLLSEARSELPRVIQELIDLTKWDEPLLDRMRAKVREKLLELLEHVSGFTEEYGNAVKWMTETFDRPDLVKVTTE